MDTWVQVPGAFTFVESGTTLLNTGWVTTAAPTGTIGVTNMPWTQFSGAGAYIAGTGLTLTGNTFSITNTAVTPASYGSASQTLTATVNQQGQLTALAASNIAIAASQLTSGTIDSSRLNGDYTGITGLGTLVNLTVTNTIAGSINGNAATATTAASATTATTATNLAGGATGSIPYQSGAGATAMLAAGSAGQVLTLAGGIPTWATAGAGTVTSVGGTGTVSGITLSGTVTSSGNLTLGGTLDLSSPPTIGNTTPNTGRFTTLTVEDNTTLGSSNSDTINFVGRINSDFEPATDNTYDLGRTGHEWRNLYIDGTANIDSLIADTADINAGTIDNTTIGVSTASSAKFTTIDFSSTLAVSGVTGTAGQVLQSNGASAPTWVTPVAYATVTDDTTTNATFYPLIANQTTGNLTTQYVSSTKLQFNPSTGIFTATGFAGSAAGLTAVPAGQLSGTIPSGVLGNSTVYIGTTAIALNRGSASQSLTGVSIDGSAGSAGSATNATNATNIGITDNTSSAAVWYPVIAANSTGNNPANTSSTKLSFVPNTGVLSATSFSGAGTGLTGTATSLSIGGNAGTVTNGVYTTSVGTVTNTMLAGSIANNKLLNSSITINGTATALGGSINVGTVTSVTGTAPVVSSGGATPAISMAAATSLVNGYLTSTDWNTFNNKTSNTGTVTSVASGNGMNFTTITATGTVTMGTPSTLTTTSTNATTTTSHTHAITTASANTVSTIVARDASGNFSAGTITAALTGNASSATNATNIGITNDTSTNADYFPLWVTANTGNLPAKVTSTKLKFNPSTGVLTTTGGIGGGAF
jgi:hypothetical protein